MPKILRHDVDLLKAVAIMAVVLYHFFDLTNASMLTSVSLFSGGYVGVDIFLVISGYLITSGICYKLTKSDFSFLSEGLPPFRPLAFAALNPSLTLELTRSLSS